MSLNGSFIVHMDFLLKALISFVKSVVTDMIKMLI